MPEQPAAASRRILANDLLPIDHPGPFSNPVHSNNHNHHNPRANQAARSNANGQPQPGQSDSFRGPADGNPRLQAPPAQPVPANPAAAQPQDPAAPATPLAPAANPVPPPPAAIQPARQEFRPHSSQHRGQDSMRPRHGHATSRQQHPLHSNAPAHGRPQSHLLQQASGRPARKTGPHHSGQGHRPAGQPYQARPAWQNGRPAGPPKRNNMRRNGYSDGGAVGILRQAATQKPLVRGGVRDLRPRRAPVIPSDKLKALRQDMDEQGHGNHPSPAQNDKPGQDHGGKW